MLERRKKKDEEEDEEESPRSLLFFLALDEGREGEEAANTWIFFFPCLRLKQGEGEGGHGTRGRGSNPCRAPAS